jgi:hypothetical protein
MILFYIRYKLLNNQVLSCSPTSKGFLVSKPMLSKVYSSKIFPSDTLVAFNFSIASFKYSD